MRTRSPRGSILHSLTLLGDEYWICRVGGSAAHAADALAIVRDVSGSVTIVSRVRAGECLGPYRVLASEELDPSLVGFLARVASILAEAGVPLMVYSSVERDYILVPSQLARRAVEALRANDFHIDEERGHP